MGQIWNIISNPLVASGICLLLGIIFARKKYQKWVALVYLLVHSIENTFSEQTKKFVSSLVKGNLKKELDDVLVELGYKNRSILYPGKSIEEIDKERLFKKFPELKLKFRL